MPIMCAVKIVWLKIYIICESLMTLTFTEGHTTGSQTWHVFNWYYSSSSTSVYPWRNHWSVTGRSAQLKQATLLLTKMTGEWIEGQRLSFYPWRNYWTAKGWSTSLKHARFIYPSTNQWKNERGVSTAHGAQARQFSIEVITEVWKSNQVWVGSPGKNRKKHNQKNNLL